MSDEKELAAAEDAAQTQETVETVAPVSEGVALGKGKLDISAVSADGKKSADFVVSPEDRKWYSLRVISGKERKIQERIMSEVERSGWTNIVFNVIVPTEKVYKVRNGKKVMQERNLLPGYILVEGYGPKLKGDIAKAIADIPNVIHFLGKEDPLPMTHAEANRLLGKVDESTETGETLSEPFLVNETVKIIDGPFAEFVGDVQEVNEEKKKLKVIVKIFGRGTEVELNFLQVEKIS